MRRAALPVVGLISLVTPLAVLALLCWWVVLSAEMPGRNWARRLLFGLIAVYATTAAALTALAVLHQPANPRLLLAGLLFTGLIWRLANRSQVSVPWLGRTQRWAMGFGGLTFAVLYLPFVGASTGRTMALLSQTTDGATHVQLLTAVLRQRGYVQLAHPHGMSPDADHYPTAWHGNVWVLADLLLGQHPSVASLVRLTAVAAVATYATLCALLATVVLEVAPYTGELPGRAVMAGLLCLGLTTTAGFGIFFLQLASYTQVFALLALLSLVLLADDPPQRGGVTLGIAAAASVSLMQSWYLLAPLLAVVLSLLLVQLRPSRGPFIGYSLVTAPLCVYPLVTGPSWTQVNVSGSTLLPTILGIVGLLAATAVGCAYLMRHQESAGGLVLVAATVASLLTMLLLIARQGYVAGSGVSYYGAKVLLTTLLLGTVLAAATAASAVACGRLTVAALAVIAVGLGTWSTAWVTIPPKVGHYEGHLEAATLEAIFALHPLGEPTGTETWVVDGCDRVGDRVATKWLPDTSLAWTDGFSAALLEYSEEAAGDASALRQRLDDPALDHLELVVHRECDPKALAQLTPNPKVRVVRVP